MSNPISKSCSIIIELIPFPIAVIIVVAIIVILAGVIGVGVSGLINTANNANNAVANSSAQVDQQIQDQEDELRGFSFAN